MSEEAVEDEVLGDKSLFVDRRAMLKALAELNAATGFVPNYTGTIQEVRQRMIDAGIRPEDNEGTRELVALREPGLRED